MKVKRFFEPVYRFDLLFISGCSFDEANKVLKRYKISPMPSELTGTVGDTFAIDEKEYSKRTIHSKAFVIWVKDKKDFYCLLHEVSHLIIDVFAEKGLTIDDCSASHEAFAYYMEFWFQKLWRAMNKK